MALNIFKEIRNLKNLEHKYKLMIFDGFLTTAKIIENFWGKPALNQVGGVIFLLRWITNKGIRALS